MTSLRLDPELVPLIAGMGRLTEPRLAEIRAAALAVEGIQTQVDGIVVREFDVPADAAPVRVVEHRPASTTPRGVIVHIHGGGFVGGSADDPYTRRWCATTAEATGCSVVAVDYRLAPEHPFPLPFDDCLDAVSWVMDNRSELGLPLDAPIVLHGQSAGGALAAGVALRLRDDGRASVSLLVLDAPVIDDRLDSPSMNDLESPIWSRDEAELSWELYLGTPSQRSSASPYAAPGRARSLAGLPPTFIAVNGADALRDEAIEFACRLLRDGVEVDLRVYARTVHGTALIGALTDSGRAIIADQIAAIVKATRPDDALTEGRTV